MTSSSRTEVGPDVAVLKDQLGAAVDHAVRRSTISMDPPAMPHSHCGKSILPGVGYVRARLGARFSSAPPRSPGVPQIREKLPLICIYSANRRHVLVGRWTRPTSRVSQEGRRQLTRGEASGLAASILTATGVMTALSHSRPRLGNWRGLRIALVKAVNSRCRQSASCLALRVRNRKQRRLAY